MQELAPGIYASTEFRRVNVGAIYTPEGWVLIDTPPYPADARRWLRQLQATHDVPVKFIINTDHHSDRTLGNYWFEGHVVAHQATQAAMRGLPNGFMEQSVELLASNDEEYITFTGVRLRPPTISYDKRLFLKLGGHTIQLTAMPGPTPGNTWLHFPEHSLLFCGDSLITGEHPYLGKTVSKAWLESLSLMRRARFRADVIVSGRGRLATKQDSQLLSEYLRMARRRVKSLYRIGRPRADTIYLVPEFLPHYPYDKAAQEYTYRYIKAGLDRVYDEIKSAAMERG